ncbi:prophage Lp2 protein 26 [Lactiplantibacillus plantarum]|nr:prophage Lp2 protein 26 [Lactiplantibacillus plantarum]MCG0605557.1 prophage Lp2 protein 26 [Lactiplantibacillus plantarum]MCG0743145.1 prophage Lp2 protein 26 [Lactiplantibacillus plantarum]MCG0930447.1 prophage Lp2 protein 26 [Lactiplantibacillus plantarum]MCG0933382.1 prophage Lp2 protein 26 [Lactiplantibacillus plantarum]
MIKFRAWDKVQKVMMVSRDVQADSDGNIFYVEAMGPDGEYDEGDLDVFKLEQFTGLKDVNGKEIYEGDVLILSRDEPKTYIYDDEDNLKPKIIMPKTVIETAPVTKYTGTFGVSVKGVFLTLREVDKGQQNIEIIGNVHENPELVEEDDD